MDLLFKEVSSHLSVHSTERVIQEVDVCILIHSPDSTQCFVRQQTATAPCRQLFSLCMLCAISIAPWLPLNFVPQPSLL